MAYIDGSYQTLGAVRARFPTAAILTVTTSGTNRADICDVESGDATPAVAAAGVRSGLYSTVYSSRSTYGALEAALSGLEWTWYAADPTGVPHLVPGSVATQWAWPGHGSPGNFDISETNGVYPGTTTPSPTYGTPFGEDTMQAVPFSLTTNAAGKMDIGIPLPAGCVKVVAVSLDVKAAEAAPAGTWDDLVVGQPAVGGTNAGEIVVYGAPNHFYTGHAICA